MKDHTNFKKCIALLSLVFLLMSICYGCAKDWGYTPISEAESLEYNKAVLRCHKIGGTRVIKIQSRLQCY